LPLRLYAREGVELVFEGFPGGGGVDFEVVAFALMLDGYCEGGRLVGVIRDGRGGCIPGIEAMMGILRSWVYTLSSSSQSGLMFLWRSLQERANTQF